MISVLWRLRRLLCFWALGSLVLGIWEALGGRLFDCLGGFLLRGTNLARDMAR
jgi:hypothetical protein